jgi:hypothetical protein
MGQLARHHLGEGHAVGSWGNALMIVWRQGPAEPAVAGVRRAAEDLLARYPAGIGVLGLSGDVGLASAAERQQLGRVLADGGQRLLGLASVIEGSHPTCHLLHSINQVSRQPCPMRAFATVDEGVTWLAPLLGVVDGKRPSMLELRRAVEQLRRSGPN